MALTKISELTAAGALDGTEMLPGVQSSTTKRLTPAQIRTYLNSFFLQASNNLSDLASASTARTNLGLGSIATQSAASVAITGGSITGITDIAVADGGTGASTAADARTNLGLVAGGAGDIWVEKAGDTMTGGLSVNAEIAAYGSSSSDVTVLTARNDSSATGTTKTITQRFRGTDTVATGKDVAYLRAVPPDENWVDGDLAVYTRLADSITEKYRFTGTGHFQMGGTNTVIDSNRLFRLRSYTVATLPTVGTAGRLAKVSDASAPAWNTALAGGGAVDVGARDNGANWVAF